MCRPLDPDDVQGGEPGIGMLRVDLYGSLSLLEIN